jgi:hypothetical protein
MDRPHEKSRLEIATLSLIFKLWAFFCSGRLEAKLEFL